MANPALQLASLLEGLMDESVTEVRPHMPQCKSFKELAWIRH